MVELGSAISIDQGKVDYLENVVYHFKQTFLSNQIASRLAVEGSVDHIFGEDKIQIKFRNS